MVSGKKRLSREKIAILQPPFPVTHETKSSGSSRTICLALLLGVIIGRGVARVAGLLSELAFSQACPNLREWMKPNWQEIGSSFLRSLVPVGLTYSAALIGIKYFGFGNSEFTSTNLPSGIVGLLVVPLFTLTHCVVPVFFYFIFVAAIQGMRQGMKSTAVRPQTFAFFLVFSGFVYLHMAIWYGVPAIVLVYFTGWLSIPIAIVHIALAKKGTRTFVFLEYGSTSFALLLFFFMFSASEIFPLGLVVAFFQIMLLTVVDWKGRDLWAKLSLGDVSNTKAAVDSEEARATR